MLNSCICDSILYYLYLARIIALVSQFTCNIILQGRYQLLKIWIDIQDHKKQGLVSYQSFFV